MELKKFFYSEKGMRPTNEDAEVLYDTENIKIFGIFDGHGSDEVSKLLKKNIIGILTNKEIKYPISKKQIEGICANIQSYIKKKPYANSAGSTANIVLIYNCSGQYYFTNINVGDSRCVIYMNDKIIQVSEDHKPTNINEYNRILKMGGKVYRDGLEYRVGDLSVSRSFGDCSNKYTFPVPDIKTFKFNSNLNFIIGCDGLFDVMKNEDICYEVNNYIKTNGKMNVARKLTSLAYNSGSTDNISVIVGMIEFKKNEINDTDKKKEFNQDKKVDKNQDKKKELNQDKKVDKNQDKKKELNQDTKVDKNQDKKREINQIIKKDQNQDKKREINQIIKKDQTQDKKREINQINKKGQTQDKKREINQINKKGQTQDKKREINQVNKKDQTQDKKREINQIIKKDQTQDKKREINQVNKKDQTQDKKQDISQINKKGQNQNNTQNKKIYSFNK